MPLLRVEGERDVKPDDECPHWIVERWMDKETGVPVDLWACNECKLRFEPINAAKKRYEAANPLGGPARMFEAIAERIRAGEEYHSVLADYGVTVEEK